MAERSNENALTANGLVLQKHKETFDRNGNVTADSSGTNVWAEAFADNEENSLMQSHASRSPRPRRLANHCCPKRGKSSKKSRMRCY